jgi:hypothetical protein
MCSLTGFVTTGFGTDSRAVVRRMSTAAIVDPTTRVTTSMRRQRSA